MVVRINFAQQSSLLSLTRSLAQTAHPNLTQPWKLPDLSYVLQKGAKHKPLFDHLQSLFKSILITTRINVVYKKIRTV